jgi:hypothetical protein
MLIRVCILNMATGENTDKNMIWEAGTSSNKDLRQMPSDHKSCFKTRGKS